MGGKDAFGRSLDEFSSPRQVEAEPDMPRTVDDAVTYLYSTIYETKKETCHLHGKMGHRLDK